MSHVPSPGDFNAPGDQNDPETIKAAAEAPEQLPSEELPSTKRKMTPEELGEALRRKEADGSEGPDPFAKQEVPQGPGEMRQDDPFQPIKELGREYSATFHIVVPDARPHVTVPLTGPGAYEVTVKRRQ